MTALLELRENLKKIYSRNEAFILPVIKFLLSFIVLSIINGKMGYMTKLDNMAIVLIVSLLCSFLPTGFMAFFAMMFAVLHMYALSIETAAVGLVVFLLLYLLFLRFTAKEALVVVLTPVLCMLKLPYVMPVAMGLIGTPASCVSVGCGVVVYYLLQTVITNAPMVITASTPAMMNHTLKYFRYCLSASFLISFSIVTLSFPHNFYTRLAIAFTMHRIAASVTPSVPA